MKLMDVVGAEVCLRSFAKLYAIDSNFSLPSFANLLQFRESVDIGQKVCPQTEFSVNEN